MQRKEYLDNGKTLVPLYGDKNIPPKDWQVKRFNRRWLTTYKGNLGWVLVQKDLIIDVDPRNGGDDSFKSLCDDLSINIIPTVKTPRGGFHAYLFVDTVGKLKKNLKQYPGIDFLSKGSYCLIAGDVKEEGTYEWYDDVLGGFEQNKAPEPLVNALNSIRIKKTQKQDLGDFEGLIAGNLTPEEKIQEFLHKLNPSMPHDEWVKVGMALHNWHPIDGLNLWEKWSKGGDNYTQGETAKRWASFCSNGGVTMGTVNHLVKEVNFDERMEKLESEIKDIECASQKKLELTIYPRIKKLSLESLDINRLAKSIQDRLKHLTGAKAPIGEIKSKITKIEYVKGELVDEDERPHWCKKWTYVNSHGGFVDCETLNLHKAESFNIANGRFVPFTDSGNTKLSAVKYVSDRGFVDRADLMMYLPSEKDLIVKVGGLKVLNSFNQNSIPEEASSYTNDGMRVIEKIKKHIKFICTSDKNALTLTQWLAHNVQFPGRKILWAPVIQSIDGVGKSFFGELMALTLGDINVGKVSPSQVIKPDYNGWAVGRLVNVLEDLRIQGRNRYAAVNALKPLITDRVIQINDKHVSQHTVYNTINYICFTNFKDALPINVTDRRWWVVFVPIQHLSEIQIFFGESHITYFPKLFDDLRKYSDQVRKWLLEFPISKEFLSLKQAPITTEKQLMISTEELGMEGYYETREMIKKGGPFWNENCVSSVDLFSAILMKHPELDLTNAKKNTILKRLGYLLLDKQIKIKNEVKKMWVKKNMTNDEIRGLFEAN